MLHGDYHENVDSYAPRQTDFYDLISCKLPTGWEITRHGIWFHCGAAHNIIPEQGWKIHLSASRTSAREILDRVSSILFAAGDTHFKFALDAPTLFLLNGKNWPRSASGKFITVYPANSRRFLELIDQLHIDTREFCGPHILSDYRYQDSRVVFYRYGGMKLREAMDVTGERTPVLIAPDGIEVPDRRMPYPTTPDWAETAMPIQQPGEKQAGSYSLRDGRFQIEGVLDFSSAGGVYHGTDRQTGAQVVIKEARPWIESSHDQDAVTLLKKEHRLLTLLADTGMAPRPVDLFQEGTHWFLAEEHVAGVSLHAHSASHNILLRTRPSNEDYRTWYETFRMIALQLSEIVRVLHSRNIVFADFSTSNLVVEKRTNKLKLIDFEAAYEIGIDQPTGICTPGFTAQRVLDGAVASREDDYYSVGAVLMAYLLPINGLFQFKREAKEEFIGLIQRDARLPKSSAEMILALLERGSGSQAVPQAAAAMLPPTYEVAGPDKEEAPAPDYGRVPEEIVEHILTVASYDRTDRLFPADAKVYSTNSLSLAYGASGIAYAIKKITGSVPSAMTEWILARPTSFETYAPGLYMGLSGISWALLELGEQRQAEKMFRLACEHPLRERAFDLFYGLAGWGMTSLRFFVETGDEVYWQRALQCGEKLLEPASDWIWHRQPDRPVGLAHGSSGVALYLLYLYLATRKERFLAAGKEALENDLAAGVETADGGLAWGAAINSQKTIYPYWRYGSAGVGTAVVRYCRVLGVNAYRSVLEKIFIDTDREYAVQPGRFLGLAGIGDFLLDAWAFTGEQKYLDSAHKIARGVMRFAVKRQGVAFPGDALSRLCCDYATGSAGIALFLNRLMGRQGADFLLDGLLGLDDAHPCRQRVQPDAASSLVTA
jgi:serine/threonine protein kinase